MSNTKFNSNDFIRRLRECDWSGSNKENVNEHEPNSGDITISPELLAQLLQASSEDAPDETAIDAAMQTMSGIMGQENRTLDSSDLANILTGAGSEGESGGMDENMGGGMDENPQQDSEMDGQEQEGEEEEDEGEENYGGDDMENDDSGMDNSMNGDDMDDDMEEEAYSSGDGEEAGDEGGDEHKGRQKLMADGDEGGCGDFDSDPMGSNEETNEDSMRDYHEDEHAKAEEEWRNRPRFGGSLEDSPEGNDGFEDEGGEEPMEGSPESKHRNNERRRWKGKEKELKRKGESKKGQFPKRTWKNKPHSDEKRIDEAWISAIPNVALGSQGKKSGAGIDRLRALSGIDKEKAPKKDIIQEAYDLGKASFKNGLPEMNNPYTEFENDKRLAWRNGWKDGKKGK